MARHLPCVRRTDRTRTRLTDVSLLLLFLFLSLCPCFFFFSPFPLRSSWQLLPEKCCDFSRNFLFVTQIIHNIQWKLRKADAKLSSAAACGYSQGCHLRVGGGGTRWSSCVRVWYFLPGLPHANPLGSFANAPFATESSAQHAVFGLSPPPWMAQPLSQTAQQRCPARKLFEGYVKKVGRDFFARCTNEGSLPSLCKLFTNVPPFRPRGRAGEAESRRAADSL